MRQKLYVKHTLIYDHHSIRVKRVFDKYAAIKRIRELMFDNICTYYIHCMNEHLLCIIRLKMYVRNEYVLQIFS